MEKAPQEFLDNVMAPPHRNDTVVFRLTKEGALLVIDELLSKPLRKGLHALGNIMLEQIESPSLLKVRADDAQIFVQNLPKSQKRALFGLLLESESEEEIADQIILHKLTPEVHKISLLLNEACRKRV